MITVNLTTTPARLPYIAPALDSLNKQSLKADRVNLCLPAIMENGEYPKVEEAFELCNEYGISLNDAEDYGPATKLIAPLESNESYIIVTADDDVIYPSNWLEALYKEFMNLQSPPVWNYAVGYRGKILGGKPYKEGICTYAQQNCEVDIITGTWGAMYKAEWFDTDELKEWLVKNQPESNYCDDIVINAYLKRKGIGRYCIKSDSEFKPTKAHSINALWDINKDAPYNDELIERLELC